MSLRTKKTKGVRVFVGMSGGVDSSVSAALLKQAGYDVIGVFIKVWSPDWLPCPWREERRDAMRVAAYLDIPFLTFDFSKEYKKEVAENMIEEYKAGRTPNPDVLCNKEIKFGSFFRKAREMGADYIATGHYAETEQRADGGFVLKENPDSGKDQSYFLWTLGQEQLSRTLFPVGKYHKVEVRKLAKKFALPTAEKKDSQGICFLGPVDMKEFLAHYIEQKPGDVLNTEGKIIGTHDGAVFYTMGERHGFTITAQTAHSEAQYVIAKDLKKNTITVAPRQNTKSDVNTVSTIKKVQLQNINWIHGAPDATKIYDARFRYHQEPQKCRVKGDVVEFRKPQSGISAGQSLVIYDGDVCMGGGIIVA